jgi:protocatechuate 4,5-dioxygenase alpha chain
MSSNGLEQVLHELSVRREARASWAQDADRFLGRFGLTQLEADMVHGHDVAGMLAAGVSPLLTYGFWMTNAQDRSRKAYLQRLGATP